MSRTPDFVLKAMDKASNAKSGKLGAGWLNSDGSISVVIDPFVVLTASPTLVLTLFINQKVSS